MQRLETCERDIKPGRRQPCGAAPSDVLDCASRVDAAPCLMPAGAGYKIPRLTGIPSEYRFVGGVESAAKLALTLISAGLADPCDWVRLGRDPFAFLAAALKTAVEKHGGNDLDSEFFMRLGLVSDLDPYACDRNEAGLQDEMYLVLEPDSAGYVVLEPALRLLSRVHPRLPTTFFDLFTGALNRWVRVYDYRDALERVEQLREWYEADPDGEQVELPAVEEAIPVWLRRKWNPLKPRFVEQFLENTNNRKIRGLMEGALRLSRTAHRASRPNIGERAEARLADSNPPVPALVAVFNKHDAIEGCFDDEAQGMLECTPEPNVILPFRPDDPASVREAFQLLGVVCDVLREAAVLISAIMRIAE